MQVEIAVLDVNDNAPLFDKSSYRTSVPENAPPGTFLLTVHATDIDSGANGMVDYELEDPMEGSFLLNSTTGALSLNMTLDFDNGTQQFSLEVWAYDRGVPGRNTSVGVVVSVTNVNDNPPIFTQSLYAGTVPEHLAEDTLVVTVGATDADATVDSALQYALALAGTNAEGLFYIDASGSVWTNRYHEREYNNHCLVRVLCVEHWTSLPLEIE